MTGITEHYAEKQTPRDDPDPGKGIHQTTGYASYAQKAYDTIIRDS